MKEEQTRERLIKWQEDKDVACRDQVVAAHMHIVTWWVGKYRLAQSSKLDRDDLTQIGCVGLLLACNGYDTTRENGNFSSLATSYVRREIHLEDTVKPNAQSRAPDKHAISFDQPHSGEMVPQTDIRREENRQLGWDSLAPQAGPEEIIESLAYDVRDAAHKRLTEKEFEVYRDHFEKGHTPAETARRLNVSRPTIKESIDRIRRKLRAHFEVEL